MTSKKTVEEFFAQPALAVVGVSRTGKKFGNSAYKTLKEKGYNVYQINPKSESIDGEKCYPDFKSIPDRVSGAVMVIKPIHAVKVLLEALDSGIKYVWLQQGADSKEAIDFCIKNGIHVVHGECIIMFAEPVKSFHRFHRWIWTIAGKMPK
jgi:predicted CoA-binding protein